MNIASTQYNLEHEALEIYISGCDGFCKGCHNPELQNYGLGEDYRKVLPSIVQKIREFDGMIKNVFIMGGEPLQQQLDCVLDLLVTIRQSTKVKIWLWTRASIENIPSFIKFQCDFIKTGYYDETQLCDNNIQYGIKLASANQKIHKLGD